MVCKKHERCPGTPSSLLIMCAHVGLLGFVDGSFLAFCVLKELDAAGNSGLSEAKVRSKCTLLTLFMQVLMFPRVCRSSACSDSTTCCSPIRAVSQTLTQGPPLQCVCLLSFEASCMLGTETLCMQGEDTEPCTVCGRTYAHVHVGRLAQLRQLSYGGGCDSD